MSEVLNQLEQAVHTWHDRRKAELNAEASFLDLLKASGDAVTMAEVAAVERFSDLIADTIAEFLA